jgi:hypothetical protein
MEHGRREDPGRDKESAERMRQHSCGDSVMKTTLIVIQNDADHADAKKLIEKLMGSSNSQDQARMVAQAR